MKTISKNYLALTLIGLFIFAFTSCGGGEDDEPIIKIILKGQVGQQMMKLLQ